MALTHFLKRIIQKRIAVFRVDFSPWKAVALPLFNVMTSWNIVTSVKTAREEDFEQLITQLALTDSELIQRQQWFTKLAMMWLSFFGLIVCYGVYLLIIKAWLSVISLLVLSMMVLSQAFQYHFWSFQIAQRRCGCSLSEWSAATFGKWHN